MAPPALRAHYHDLVIRWDHEQALDRIQLAGVGCWLPFAEDIPATHIND